MKWSRVAYILPNLCEGEDAHLYIHVDRNTEMIHLFSGAYNFQFLSNWTGCPWKSMQLDPKVSSYCSDSLSKLLQKLSSTERHSIGI